MDSGFRQGGRSPIVDFGGLPMRRRVLTTAFTTAMLGGSLVATAPPAMAADSGPDSSGSPERRSEYRHFQNLEFQSTGCIPEPGEPGLCTTAALLVRSEAGAEGQVVIISSTAEMESGNLVRGYSGDVKDFGGLTVTKNLTVTLQRVPITVQTYFCPVEDPTDCQDGPTKTVTVSASGVAVGPVDRTRLRRLFFEGNCRIRSTLSMTHSSLNGVEGSLTVDDVTSEASGSASQGTERVRRHCRKV